MKPTRKLTIGEQYVVENWEITPDYDGEYFQDRHQETLWGGTHNSSQALAKAHEDGIRKVLSVLQSECGPCYTCNLSNEFIAMHQHIIDGVKQNEPT